MTSEMSNSVKLSFGKNKLEITANSRRSAKPGNPGHQLQGRGNRHRLQSQYVIDPLKALTNDEIFFELIDELSPGVIKINGPFLYVVMPMRLS